MINSMKGAKMQTVSELNKWYESNDPWGYENNPDDEIRKSKLLEVISRYPTNRVLDIGCGNGFITKDIRGGDVYGVDLSPKAIEIAKLSMDDTHTYVEGSIFDIGKMFNEKFSMVIVTGVLYPQYIGKAAMATLLAIDRVLMNRGVYISVHIESWESPYYPPYLIEYVERYKYRDYIHRLVVYRKMDSEEYL